MHKKLLYLLLVSFSIVGIGLYIRALKVASSLTPQNAPSEVLGTDRHSVFVEVVKPTYEKPSSIKIDSIGIDTQLVEVTVEPDGALEAPKDWYKAGWYKDSAHAGEPGNMIIDGHYDTNTGAPAAFYSLKNIKTGDIVTFVDEVGRKFSYEVREIFYLDINDPNRLQIFDEKKDTAHVTIITCGGVWLPGSSTYSKRLVVKAELSAEAGR